MKFFVVMLALLYLEQICHSTGTLHRNDDNGLVFDLYPAQRLTLSQAAKQKSTLVEDNMECVFECIGVHWCRSVNYNTTPQSNGLYVCEFLSSDQLNNNMTQDLTYNHYSVENTGCEKKPCRNHGECTLQDNRRDYQCNCKYGMTGKHCENCNEVLFDFESGKLDGWTLTGTAFNNQPTYGDNPVARARETANITGNWWIGGFENRSSPSHTAGETQADGPTGTMTSPVFIIKGTKIKFLIGGGPDINTERLELLIGGVVVDKASTNTSSETMNEKEFDVNNYRGQTAQLRLVDQSTGDWGHINLDHVEEICPD